MRPTSSFLLAIASIGFIGKSLASPLLIVIEEHDLTPSPSTSDETNILPNANGPWPTHLPNNWVAYSQTGGALGGAVISACVTIGISGRFRDNIIQSFQNSGTNLVKTYAYNAWDDFSHVAGLQSSMAVVKAEEWFNYAILSNIPINGFITVMFKFHTVEGIGASTVSFIARVIAGYWNIGHIEPNYNPQRPHVIQETSRDERDNVFVDANANTVEHDLAGDFCAGVYATSPSDKVDKYAGNVPETASCEFHAGPHAMRELKMLR